MFGTQQIFHRYKPVLALPAVRRLAGISFLGALDPMAAPDRRSSRYEHTLGVAGLTAIHAQAAGWGAATTDLAIVAALLHDIGHSPLSHSGERVLLGGYGEGHHRQTLEMLEDRDLIRTLRDMDVSVEVVRTILDGNGEGPVADLFSGCFSPDTLDGIARTLWATGGGWVDPVAVIHAARDLNDETNLAHCDAFWRSKDRAYHRVIRSREGILLDVLCDSLLDMHRERIEGLGSRCDRDLFLVLPDLENALSSRSPSGHPALRGRVVDFVERRFVVNESRHGVERYSSTKVAAPFESAPSFGSG